MENPFSFGVLVSGQSFCNRHEEHDHLLNYCRTSQNVLLYSHRRIGKTSLIHHVFRTLELKNPGIRKLYIDLYGVLTERQFVSNIFKSLSQVETRIEKLVEFSKSIFRTVRLNFSFDTATGAPVMTPSFQTEDREIVLEEVMKLVERYSKDERAVVVFDEFQEIENFRDETFEKRLRKIIQHHRKICYVFMGSKRHILNQMFNTESRAFYQSAELYPLYPIQTEHYLAWIRTLFSEGGKSNPTDLMIEKVIKRCNNYPIYVQQYFHYLWNQSEITDEIIDRVESDIISRNHDKFLNQWDALTLNQRKTLNLIIISEGKNIYYADNIQAVGLKSPSQVKKAIEVLLREDIVVKNTTYRVQDIIFDKWIRRLM